MAAETLTFTLTLTSARYVTHAVLPPLLATLRLTLKRVAALAVTRRKDFTKEL